MVETSVRYPSEASLEWTWESWVLDNLEPVAQSVCQRSESVLEAETEVEDRVAARVACRALEVRVACWSVVLVAVEVES